MSKLTKYTPKQQKVSLMSNKLGLTTKECLHRTFEDELMTQTIKICTSKIATPSTKQLTVVLNVWV